MIKSLTSLRGVFILFIFFHHCLGIYPRGGTMAVTFFFVLGGFSMTLGYRDKVMKPDFSYKNYLVKRCIKFFPLHWICILIVLPLTIISFKMSKIPLFFANAALLQSWIPIKEVYFSFNWVSWYLADTMFFAVMFPFVLKWLIHASSIQKGMLASLILLIYAVVAILIPVEKYHAILYISPFMRLTDFILGIFLALLYLKLSNKPFIKWDGNFISQLIIGALITMLVVESCLLPEYVTFIAPAYWLLVALIILITSLSERIWGGQNILQNRYLQRLGEISFIIFMIHQIVLRYFKLLFYKILHFESDIVFVFFTLGLTLVLSLAVEKYLLNPITQWLTKRIQPSMIARS